MTILQETRRQRIAREWAEHQARKFRAPTWVKPLSAPGPGMVKKPKMPGPSPESQGMGHWATIKHGAHTVHVFIGPGGFVTKGPQQMHGHAAGHLQPIAGVREVKHLSAKAQPPKGALEHPDYGENENPEPAREEDFPAHLEQAV